VTASLAGVLKAERVRKGKIRQNTNGTPYAFTGLCAGRNNASYTWMEPGTTVDL
jgi:hypothetical protein